MIISRRITNGNRSVWNRFYASGCSSLDGLGLLGATMHVPAVWLARNQATNLKWQPELEIGRIDSELTSMHSEC